MSPIPGIVAAQTLQISGGHHHSGGLTPLAIADFVNGVYSYEGHALTVADVVNLTARVSASGLEIISGTPVNIIGSILTLLLTANYTIVMEVNLNSDAVTNGHAAHLLTVGDSASFNSQLFFAVVFGDEAGYFENNGGAISRFTTGSDNLASIGINKIAWTRTDVYVAYSLNGVAVNADTQDNTSNPISGFSPALAIAEAADGDDPPNSLGFIRSITIYTPQDNATLATLSA